MRVLKLFLSVFLFAVAISASNLAFAPNPVGAVSSSASTCPNTWCAPGWSSCSEELGWECSLDGGCVGAHQCL